MNDASGHDGLRRRLIGSLERGLKRISVVEAWQRAIQEALEEPIAQFDRSFMRWLLPWMERFASYFGAEVRGLDRLPHKGPMLLVGNHSGGVITPDTTALYAAWYRERGLDDPLFGLGFDGAFTWPVIGKVMRKIGQIPGSQRNAEQILSEGAALLVYPGGAYEVFRPWPQRNQIQFGRHKGFIQLALRTGVPVVPVVAHGGHETLIVLSRGERMAEWLGLERIRTRVFPIVLQVPWGVSTPAQPGIPLPAKITLQVCDPIDWSRHGPRAANDPAVVDACYQEITTLMQRTLTGLAREHPVPLVARLRELVALRGLPGMRRTLLAWRQA